MAKRFEWFDWRDLILPIAPGIGSIVLFFMTWEVILLVVGLMFLATEGIIIKWRLGK